MRLIDSGTARSILSFKIYSSLPVSSKFSLGSASATIALADDQQAKTHGLGHVVVCMRSKEFEMHVIVAEVEDDSILGMDLLINAEVFNCCDFKNQPLSSDA